MLNREPLSRLTIAKYYFDCLLNLVRIFLLSKSNKLSLKGVGLLVAMLT